MINNKQTSLVVSFETSLLGIKTTQWLFVQKSTLKTLIYQFSNFLKLLNSTWHFYQPLQINHKLSRNWYHHPPIFRAVLAKELLFLFRIFLLWLLTIRFTWLTELEDSFLFSSPFHRYAEDYHRRNRP